MFETRTPDAAQLPREGRAVRGAERKARGSPSATRFYRLAREPRAGWERGAVPAAVPESGKRRPSHETPCVHGGHVFPRAANVPDSRALPTQADAQGP